MSIIGASLQPDINQIEHKTVYFFLDRPSRRNMLDDINLMLTEHKVATIEASEETYKIKVCTSVK